MGMIGQSKELAIRRRQESLAHKQKRSELPKILHEIKNLIPKFMELTGVFVQATAIGMILAHQKIKNKDGRRLDTCIRHFELSDGLSNAKAV